MSLFKCGICQCVENTALGFYWMARADSDAWEDDNLNGKPLCSECSPAVYKDGSSNKGGGEWHGCFPKENADEAGYIEGKDGFLYKAEELAPGGYFEQYAPKEKPDAG